VKILQLRSSDVFSSPERLIIGQCRHLPEFEFVCGSFVAPGRVNRFLDECRAAKIETAELADSFPGDLRLIGHLRRLMIERRIDLVITHDYKASFYAFFARRKLAVKQIAYFHGVTSEDKKVRIYNAIDRQVLKRLPQVIAVSERTRQLLTDMGVPVDRIEVVPNAIDDASLISQNQFEVRREGPARIIAAGRFSFEKGFDLLLQALGKAGDNAPPFQVDLYGLGPEEDKLRRMVDDFALQGTVTFKGFVDSLLPALREADFLVMPSRSEGMPVTVLEAWSQRLGLIATAVGGVPEIVSNGNNGLLIPPENVDALAEKIVWATENIDRMQQYGAAGFDLVREKYTYSRQAEQLRQIYSRT